MSTNECWYKDVCSHAKDSCQNLCVRFTEMNYLMMHSNLPESKQSPIRLSAPKVDADAFRTLNEIRQDVANFVSNGEQLYICSEFTGNGKTSWAIKIMHAYFNSVWDGNGLRPRALYVPVAWFLLKSKEFKKVDAAFEELKNLIMTVDLVVWDDIGTANMSSYDFSNLLMYIDHRTNNCMSNIFTGNITSRADMEKALGQRIADRILAKSTTIVEFKGGSMR